MKLTKVCAPLVALGVAGIFTFQTPEEADGFVIFGFALNTSQRDVRVFNNFSDASSNNNQTPNAQFPGYQGADMAIWKSIVEWGSELHGNGSGDPHQGNALGSGGANFDATWQGSATSAGGQNSNVFSALSGSSGGVYAFISGASSNGWTGKFYDGSYNWIDGPSSTNGADLQGISTHEYGHSIGLGHSSASGATMRGSVSVSGSDNNRSINGDDIAGLQAAYGAKSGSKPRITGVSINGGLVTVTGSNFTNSGNEVWFTQASAGGTGLPVKVTNVSSPSNNSITVSLPGNAGPGDVLVKKSGGTTGAFLSNAWPFDPGSQGPPPGDDLAIASISPSTVDAILVDNPGNNVTLTGSGFLTVQDVLYDGVPLLAFPAEFVVVSDNTLTLTTKPASKLGNVTITLDDGAGTTVNTTINVVPNDPPVLEIPQSDPSFVFGALGIEIFMGASPFDGYLLWVSRDLVGTSVPGILDLDIGNNFTSLLFVTGPVIPSNGWFSVAGNFPSANPGTVLYWQGSVFKASVGDFPLVKTNVQKVTLL